MHIIVKHIDTYPHLRKRLEKVTSKLVPDWLLHFPNILRALQEGCLFRIRQRQHCHTLYPMARQAAGNAEEHITLNAIESAHTCGDGNNAALELDRNPVPSGAVIGKKLASI